MNRDSTLSSDAFGCKLDKLTVNQELPSHHMSILRKGSDGGDLGRVEMKGKDRGMLVGLSLSNGHSRRTANENYANSHRFDSGSVYIRDQSEDYGAEISGAFDFILFDVPYSTIAQFARDAGLPSVRTLTPVAVTKDPILANLASAVIPSLKNPAAANPFFLEQITAAVATHLVQSYGGQPVASSSGQRKLSHSHEQLAKEMLMANLDGKLTISDVAVACDMSRGHFIRMFRETTGSTPHRWLVEARVKRASDMLRNSNASLAEIAELCGFSDQSHFTRVFLANFGVPPGVWRRRP
nr:AraC family transcriptional regulator [Rhizobium cellulosilyticum]